MDYAEVKRMNDEELAVEIDRLQRRLYDYRCQTVTEKIEDPSQFKKTRRDIARLKTEQNARRARGAAS